MRKMRWPMLDAFLGRRRRGQAPPEWVIVGLGNPGDQYARTRHNVGFWCIDEIARRYGITFSRRNRSALVGEGTIDGHPVALAKPRTHVNHSGQAIAYLLARFPVAAEGLLVIYDDMDLPLGRIRLRPGGGAGGHNGIKSIIDASGTRDFPRMRVGVGHPPPGTDPVTYVLGTMPEDDVKTAEDAIERVTEAVSSVVADGIGPAMNKFN